MSIICGNRHTDLGNDTALHRQNKSDYAHLSVGVYFNNRLWMAVPLDSSAGLGDATKLNSILVYNLLNQGFESIDSVNSVNFAIRELLVGEGAKTRFT